MVLSWIFVLAIVLISVVAHRFTNAGRFAKPLNADDFAVEKKGSGARGKFWTAVARVAGFSALLAWFGFVAQDLHFDATRPVKPNSATGAVIPHNNHGHIVYLTDHDQNQLLTLQRIPIGLALVAIVSAYFHKRATGKMPN